jgi:phenylalanyl-tRNA synthetase beta chain
MKITLSWINKFLDTGLVSTEQSIIDLENRLNNLGIEVAEIIDRRQELEDFKVVEIIESSKHPNADKLSVCKVNAGNGEVLNIVCGANNAKQGLKTVLAPVGSVVPNGKFKIKKSKLRGVTSEGMLCSASELLLDCYGISEVMKDGIIEVPDGKIGSSISRYYGLDDIILDLEITPNRGDLMSILGVARDIAASQKSSVNFEYISKAVADDIITTEEIVKSTSCIKAFFAKIKNINSEVSVPTWMMSKLRAVGISSVHPVVDILNYITHELGHPMHAYDVKALKGNLYIDNCKENQKFLALNNQEYDLQKGDLVVRDQESIHCLAGIIGGKISSCSAITNEITIESAVFDHVKIMQTSTRLSINTSAQQRFARQVDFQMTELALEKAIKYITEICGGNVIETKQFCQRPESKSRSQIQFSEEFLEKKCGHKIATQKEIQNILSFLGFEIVDDNSFVPPSYRNDISIPEDLVEEIVRVSGYDGLKETRLDNDLKALVEMTAIEKAKSELITLGYHELITWSFMNRQKAEHFALNDTQVGSQGNTYDDLEVKNPITIDMGYMRPRIIPNLLDAVHKNQARSFQSLAFMEVGPIFYMCNKKLSEKTVLTAVKTGAVETPNIHQPIRDVDFFDIKGDLEHMLKGYKYSIKSNAPSYYHPFKSACFFTKDEKILTYFGQIHPKVQQAFKISSPVFALEIINFEEDADKLSDISNYSDYQIIKRDFCFVINNEQSVGPILSYLKSFDSDLIKSVELFDLYKIDEKSKSISISISLQSSNHTITDDEVNSFSEKIISQTEEKFSATLRK